MLEFPKISRFAEIDLFRPKLHKKRVIFNISASIRFIVQITRPQRRFVLEINEVIFEF